jgi:hypothetical protein
MKTVPPDPNGQQTMMPSHVARTTTIKYLHYILGGTLHHFLMANTVGRPKQDVKPCLEFDALLKVQRSDCPFDPL